VAVKADPKAQYPWLRHYDAEVPKSLEYHSGTILELVEKNVREHPERRAIVFFGRVTTFGQVGRAIDRLAAGLAALGVGAGDRVALLLPNCPQYIYAFYALMKLGAVIVPVNPLSAERELEFIFTDAGVKAVIALDLLAGRLQKVRERVPSVKTVVYTSLREEMPFPLNVLYPLKQKLSPEARAALGKGLPLARLPAAGGSASPATRAAGAAAVASARAGAPTPPVPAKVDPARDVAVLIYTGGTTGRPKGVMLSHRALVVNSSHVAAWGQVDHRDSILAVLPLFHGFGMSVCMNTPLGGGGCTILVPRFEAGEVLRLIHRYRPTIFIGVPTMFVALINHPDVKKYDLSSIRGCFAGAAALPGEVKRRFEELTGGKLLEGYGLTEAVTAKCANPYRGLNKVGSIGIPFPDTVMQIVDIETGEKVLPAGEVGEIRLRSPDLMLGYWNRPAETAEALRGGWLYTGDLGKMDEDGFFYIVERKKDLIITGGFNVYPKEVEEVLYLHPAVEEACVVGIPDDYRGEAVKAFVKLREGRTAGETDIIAFCREHLTPYKVPRSVEFVTEFPKSAIGKILRRELRQRRTK